MNVVPSTSSKSETVAILLSCDSFESFFGRVLQLDHDKYVRSYRNDWSWYYALGLRDNGLRPIIYIPSLQRGGFYETESGVGVRFLQLAPWYRPIASVRRAMRATRWSLYLQERLNAAAFLGELNRAIESDGTGLLYTQEYWNGRFDHLAHRVSIPISAVDQGGLAKGVVKWFKRSALAKASAIYCQSSDECEQVRRYGVEPTFQPNGGDTAFFTPPPEGVQRRKNIVTVARLTDKQKRTSDLIRAMALLPNDWTLDIIGIGPDLNALKLLTKSIGVESRVQFRGFQNLPDVRNYLWQCGVYAMPSANEGICLAMLEAMSCGAAVAGSKIRTFETLITNGVNGVLFPVGDVSALAKAIEEAWSRREQLGQEATKSIARDFNASTLYQRLATTMRQSLSGTLTAAASKVASAQTATF